jgi:hypothetical protein
MDLELYFHSEYAAEIVDNTRKHPKRKT